jgi:hypothetical protein
VQAYATQPIMAIHALPTEAAIAPLAASDAGELLTIQRAACARARGRAALLTN